MITIEGPTVRSETAVSAIIRRLLPVLPSGQRQQPRCCALGEVVNANSFVMPSRAYGRTGVVGDNGQTVRGTLPGWCRRASRMLGFGLVFASGILRSRVDVISILFHRPVALSHIEVPPYRPIPRCSPHLNAFIEGGSQIS